MGYRKKTLRQMTVDQKKVANAVLLCEKAVRQMQKIVGTVGDLEHELKIRTAERNSLQMLVDRINSNGAHPPEPLFPTEEKELATAKVTAHCVNCDSESIVMYNALCSWDDDRQEWVVDGGSDLMYQCSDCGFDKNDVVIKKENE